MANFKPHSRYNNGTVAANRAGKNFLVLRQPLNLVEDAGDILVTVTQDMEKRPDIVANYAYGDPELWWVIYEFNEIRDPIFGLKQGMILRLPSHERVLAAIEQLGT